MTCVVSFKPWLCSKKLFKYSKVIFNYICISWLLQFGMIIALSLSLSFTNYYYWQYPLPQLHLIHCPVIIEINILPFSTAPSSISILHVSYYLLTTHFEILYNFFIHKEKKKQIKNNHDKIIFWQHKYRTKICSNDKQLTKI